MVVHPPLPTIEFLRSDQGVPPTDFFISAMEIHLITLLYVHCYLPQSPLDQRITLKTWPSLHCQVVHTASQMVIILQTMMYLHSYLHKISSDLVIVITWKMRLYVNHSYLNMTTVIYKLKKIQVMMNKYQKLDTQLLFLCQVDMSIYRPIIYVSLFLHPQ